MFEVGFSEIVLIMLIALVVLGPEKLPKLAADVGRWVGRARAMARQLRTQLDQEVQLDEMLREKPAPTPPPSYPPPNQTPAGYAAGAAAATGVAAAGADTTVPPAEAPAVPGASGAPTDVAAPPGAAPAADSTDPVGAMQDAPRSREAAYAAYVAQTQATFQNPPAVGPGAPEIGAPTDDAHSHGEAHAAAAVSAPAADTTEPDRAHGHRQS